jgi:hypothetical protein
VGLLKNVVGDIVRWIITVNICGSIGQALDEGAWATGTPFVDLQRTRAQARASPSLQDPQKGPP